MGTPKALLDFHGETFVARLTRVLGIACESVTIVLGHNAEVLLPHLPESARIGINPDASRGQLSSLQTALAGLPGDVEGFAFIPVDCPAVAEATVVAIAQAFRERRPDTKFVIPRKEDKRGHPVLAVRSIADEFLALAPTDEARSVVHRYVPNTEYVDVDDPGIFADIDTPGAYRRLLEETRA